MRRVLTVLVLASFAAGPALRVPCFVACSQAQRATAPESCHSDATSGPALAAAHGCPSDGLAVALVIKRADTASPQFSASLIDVPAALLPGPSRAVFSATFAAPSPPLVRYLVPLRI